MSRTALRCMAFLVGITDERPTRARIAAALKRSERSLERPIAELVKAGWIMCDGGGNGTPSKIIILNSLDWKMRGDSKTRGDSAILRCDSRKMRGDSPAKSVGVILEQTQLAEEQPASLPPRSENRGNKTNPNPNPNPSVAPEVIEFVRRRAAGVLIGGKPADEGTVRRLAVTLHDLAGCELLDRRFDEWCRTSQPKTWGIVVELARDVAYERQQRDVA
jgi:hypothetical protein